jgi:ankyrin repeat protein
MIAPVKSEVVQIKAEIPQESKIEFYERRPQAAEFDRVDFAINFVAGKDGIGAIISSFQDNIIDHDAIVKVIEEKWKVIDVLQRDYNKKNRLFRNLDSAWNNVHDKPEEFAEYCKLIPKMKNIEQRLLQIKDAKVKAALELSYERFKYLDPTNKTLLIIKKSLETASISRNAAKEIVVKAEFECEKLLEKERALAAHISDDHIIADEKRILISEVFPNIHVGYILIEFNGENVETTLWKILKKTINKTKGPHTCVFKRYDYRYSRFTMEWKSLQELRDDGVCIEDPMIPRSDFVNLAARGETDQVRVLLTSGEDPECCDYTGCTAFHMAAVNQHEDIVLILKDVGVAVDCRDRNMMTPLLACIRKGHVDMVRILADLGADKGASDRNWRGALFYAMMSGNANMIWLFLNSENVNEPDKIWGYTALHIAASQGIIDLVVKLVDFGSSIYKKDNSGKTSEIVAADSGSKEVFEYLRDERLGAVGQFVFSIPDVNFEVWIGEYEALDPEWSTDVGITEVVCFTTNQLRPRNASWLRDDKACHHKMFLLNVEDDDETSKSFENFQKDFQVIVNYVKDLFKKGNSILLITDPSGDSTSVAIFSAVCLVLYQQRVIESIRMCNTARPSVRMSLSLHRGLENMQTQMEEKKMKRLKDKLRDAEMVSVAF